MSNSLASVHPELIPEWSERNLPLTPDKITFGSNKRVWWKGACGHEWETSVKARSKGEKCPICSGARVIEGMAIHCLYYHFCSFCLLERYRYGSHFCNDRSGLCCLHRKRKIKCLHFWNGKYASICHYCL